MAVGQIVRYASAVYDNDKNIGTYLVVSMTSKELKLRRLTKPGGRTFKKLHKIPLGVTSDGGSFVRGMKIIQFGEFDSFTDSWSIVARSKEEYMPTYKRWCESVYPRWKLAADGYPRF